MGLRGLALDQGDIVDRLSAEGWKREGDELPSVAGFDEMREEIEKADELRFQERYPKTKKRWWQRN